MMSRSHIRFCVIMAALLAVISIFYQNYQIAMWIGFATAAFSAIGNDSLQTLGTFLISNRKIKWYILWGFVGGIFAAVITYGWIDNQGDMSFERLKKIPIVSEFSFFQLLAPWVLVVLTHFKIPISTTFLILSVFSTSKTIEAMISKTLIGYGLSFVVGVIVFGTIAFFLKKQLSKSLSRKDEKLWRILQWLSTGFLWASWLMQDTANIVVFLPRQANVFELIAVVFIGVTLIGVLLYMKGGKIQEIIEVKKDVTDVRIATFIDITFAFILLYFKKLNSIPMSTTWVFLGLIAGREIILEVLNNSNRDFFKTFKHIGKDISLASIGLIVSVALWWLSGM